jgi:predicted MFS family arabinose efflux permease
LLPLCVGALLMGVSSTAVWSFGANILRGDFDFGAAQIAWTWIALGIAGLSGSVTGLLTNRFGTRRVLAFALLAMAAGTLGLVAASLSTINAFVAISLFGAAYITASGVYLIQGIDLLPDRPDLGLGIPFLALALGQAAGAPLFGAVQEAIGTTVAIVLFSAVACLAIVFRPQPDVANALRTGNL